MQALILFTVLWTCGLSFTCLDPKNNFVDWYTVYKIPKMPRSTDPSIEAGVAHYYLDVHSPQFTFSDRWINESQQAVYQTLAAVYANENPDTMYMMYSDQPPRQDHNGFRGHTKGVVAFNQTSGFWLVHSVPRFPPRKSTGFNWPDNAKLNGQSLLCISFKYDKLENIAKQILVNEATLYDYDVPKSIREQFPDLQKIINKNKPPDSQSIIAINSYNGQQFTSFAKSREFEKDLYHDLVAPTLEKDLQVKTWTLGSSPELPSNCAPPFKVNNIDFITFKYPRIRFPTTKDHSKWAVSWINPDDQGKNVSKNNDLKKRTCIGDINRVESQYKRGGGTVCLEHEDVWQAYSRIAECYEKC